MRVVWEHFVCFGDGNKALTNLCTQYDTLHRVTGLVSVIKQTTLRMTATAKQEITAYLRSFIECTVSIACKHDV